MNDADADAEGQRRIELHSPKDLAYLMANVRVAAVEHLHAAFPQSGGEDELRNEIEAIVNDYIDKTFALAAPNLSINGLPVQPSDFLPSPSTSTSKIGRKSSSSISIQEQSATATAYEPFDAYKRQRVADLVSREEDLLGEVAALKRAVPASVAASVAARLDDAAARDEAQLERRLQDVSSTANTSSASGLQLVPQLERQEGVEERFRAAVGVLGQLKRDMPSVVAKMERARVAGEYVRDEP